MIFLVALEQFWGLRDLIQMFVFLCHIPKQGLELDLQLFTGCRLCRRPPMLLPLPIKATFVFRTDVAFAAMGASDARSDAAWAV